MEIRAKSDNFFGRCDNKNNPLISKFVEHGVKLFQISEASTLPILHKEGVVVVVEEEPRESKQEVQEEPQEEPKEEDVVQVENVSERGSIHEVT